MKNPYHVSSILGAAMIALATAGHSADVVLSPGSALPPGAGLDSGFAIRTVQGPETPPLGNTLTRAIRQLNGTLRDASSQLVPNQAIPGTQLDGSHTNIAINFDLAGFPVMGLNTAPFPGIPGTENHTQNFVVEAVAFIQLTAGIHTFGMATSADRTDANDDDGYVVFSGANPRSFFATPVGSFQRTVTQPFQSNQLNTNYFTFEALADGLYPFRVVYWQTGHGVDLIFFSINAETSEMLLINDPFSFSGVPAFFTATGSTRANGPYVAEVSPSPGVSGIAPSEPVQVVLVDGANPVKDATVKLFLNNVQVTPQSATRNGSQLALRYDPSATRTVVSNLMRVEFEDTAGLKDTNTWQFSIVAGTAARTLVTGQWDFELLDLSATVGQPLRYLDGPGGATEAGTKFGTCASLGVALINGEDAKIMEVPYIAGNDPASNWAPLGYVMEHGIAPNGGGTRVNQFTLIMDVLVDTSGGGAASLLNMSTANNTDGDLFWQGNNFGQGGNGYNGAGTFTAGEWHRVAIAYDEAATPAFAAKYVDGVKQHDWTAGHALDNDRRSLAATALLFADGDGDNERRKIWVNSIQIRSGKLSDAELASLGGPSSSGIPATIAETGVTGQWDFNVNNGFLNGFLAPTVGKPLQYLDGAGGATETGTRFGTCSALGVALLNGEDASIMEVPYIAGNDPASNWAPLGYVMEHGIAPNGGGTRVNQFTLIMDVLVDTSGGGAASLLNMSTANNTDGDLFWQGNNFGQGGNGYNGAGTFTAGEWHRVAIAYDEAATPAFAAKYVDGVKQHDWTAGHALDNDRRSLAPTAILFADGDGDNERRKIWVNSIQIRAGKLSDAEIAALGGPSSNGIPVIAPKSTVAGQWDFNVNNGFLNGFLAPTVGKPLQYLDGAGGATETGTRFGTCSALGVALLNGEDASIMEVPYIAGNDPASNWAPLGYVMEHGIAPNGGGTRVNQFTLIMDVLVDTSGGGAASLLNMSTANNTDGDLFWQGNNFGQGGNGYNGAGTFTAGEWHRVAIAYDEAANPAHALKYVDGIFQADWTAGHALDNDRRSLAPTAILFADGDGDNERRKIWVNSVQIRAGKLSDAELIALGAASATGIPTAITLAAGAPKLAIVRQGDGIRLGWPASAAGYRLESTASLSSPDWQEVASVNNTADVVVDGQPRFFRLVNP